MEQGQDDYNKNPTYILLYSHTLGLHPRSTSPSPNNTERTLACLKIWAAFWEASSIIMRRKLMLLLEIRLQSGRLSNDPGKSLRFSSVRASVFIYRYQMRLPSRLILPPCILAMHDWSPRWLISWYPTREITSRVMYRLKNSSRDKRPSEVPLKPPNPYRHVLYHLTGLISL